MFREAVRRDLDHPIAANFFPTMPIALIVLALDFLKYPDLLLAADAARHLAFWLWLLGSIGIYVMGFAVLPRIYRHEAISLEHANFGWYIPPVSKLIIPVAGFELAAVFPGRFEVAFGLSVASLGVGTVLFLFVGSAVYHRYVFGALPMSRFAATSFIAVAPTAIIAVVLFKMIHLFEAGTPLDVDPVAFAAFAEIALLAAWGFAAWAFVMALVVTTWYLRRLDLPYALSWWAFTFPSGALAVATGVAWQVSGFESIEFLYQVTVAFLLAVWSLVAFRTARGAVSGTVFAPTH
jgi:C4-dicarboxylate transporter/malic acid transport protein